MRISDWSSDVCSSDLNITVRNIFGFRSNKVAQVLNTGATGPLFFPDGTQFSIFHAAESLDRQYLTNELQILGSFDGFDFIVGGFQIGRASCRERVCQYV